MEKEIPRSGHTKWWDVGWESTQTWTFSSGSTICLVLLKANDSLKMTKRLEEREIPCAFCVVFLINDAHKSVDLFMNQR